MTPRTRAAVDDDKLPEDDDQADETAGERTAAAAEPRPRQIEDKEFVKRHGLTDEYVAAVLAGEIPDPPYIEPDNAETELHFAGGSWQVTRKGMAPGESTAISR
jgi:hypothetical protein